MPSRDDRHRSQALPGAQGRLLKGYAPLAVALLVIAAIVVVRPSTAPDALVSQAAKAGTKGQPATGWGKTVTACKDRAKQVEGDSYSPPCFAFTGGNGGATTTGVTAKTITVTYRRTAEPNVLSLLATLMGIKFDETPKDFERTMAGLVDYFNKNFQLYGRRMVLEPYQGAGTLAAELTGGGQEAANNDGIKAATELKAFADITAVTQPYSEGLIKQRVIALGAPYMSREWFTTRRPFAWSLASDCSVVAEGASEYGLKRLIGRPAVYAGGKLKGKTRKLAVIAPNNPQYQQCTKAGLAVIKKAGKKIDYVTDYALDLGRIPNFAKSISAQIVSKGITTVSCFCDPLMLLNLTSEIDSQGLQPEWIVTGVGFGDLDLIGQGLAKKNKQWNRAFGASPLAQQPPRSQSPGYRAFKSVRPNEEPSQVVDVFYYQLYQLALGIQMAGPDLTPTTFETGMFTYPKASGPAGTWDYFPQSYTPIVDAREVWWDPNKVSPFNGQKGSYASTDKRFALKDVPPGQPQVFRR
ncbi:MAG: hypothetical protein HYX34_14465 [Actinobacteria bacterium]|nr:hypothetical protein [Actinomycetota bacterium]